MVLRSRVKVLQRLADRLGRVSRLEDTLRFIENNQQILRNSAHHSSPTCTENRLLSVDYKRRAWNRFYLYGDAGFFPRPD